jgi:hypothetical protein
MRTRLHFVLLGAIVAITFAACRPAPSPTEATMAEQPIRRLPLTGPAAESDAEISGLTWHGDQLILLPQFPRRGISEQRGHVFTLSRSAIDAALADSAAPPLTPRPLPVLAEGLGDETPEYEGCEAIVVQNGRVYLIVEATAEAAMRGYLVGGTVSAAGDTIRMDARSATAIPLEPQVVNMSYESLLAVGDTLVTFYEANGANVNARPQVQRFTTGLQPMKALPFPTIEYRITDVTEADSAGRFWAINYFYPGERERLDPAPDSLALRYGTGATHRRSEAVERLVEFQYTPHGIRRTERPPILLQLAENDARNWEGIVRLGTRGFLIATDQFPETIFAFVPLPEDHSNYSRPAKSTTTGK